MLERRRCDNAVMNQLDLTLRGDFIALDALLKATGLAESGGRARAVISEGLVLVDGQVETRKSCKIRAGQQVVFDGHQVSVKA